MLSLFILLVLFVGAYSGYKQGIVLQLLETIGYVIAVIFALDYYKIISDYFYLLIPYPSPFAPQTNPYLFYDEKFMFSLDISYYDMLGFLAVYLVGWLVVKFFTKLLSYTLEKLKAPESISGIGGAILGIFVNYMGVFFVLIVLTTIPYEMVQNTLKSSTLADTMITSTPKISDEVYRRFIVDVYDEVSKKLPTMDIQLPTSEEEASDETTEENQE